MSRINIYKNIYKICTTIYRKLFTQICTGYVHVKEHLFVCCVKLLCELIEEAWDDLIRGNGVLVSKSKSQKNVFIFFFGSRTD